MNIKLYIFFSIWSTLIFAFTFHDNLIPMTFNGETLDIPFLGGFNRPKIQWVDWDDDGDTDLFLQDEDNHLRYYENLGDSFSYDFYLITTNFQNLNSSFFGIILIIIFILFLFFQYKMELNDETPENFNPKYSQSISYILLSLYNCTTSLNFIQIILQST